MIEAVIVLGVVVGYVLARSVPDETGWYKKYFFWASIVLGVVAVLVATYEALLSSHDYLYGWAGLFLLGLLLYGFASRRVYLFALGVGGAAVIGGLYSYELLCAALIPATGWLYGQGVRRGLWWFLLVPIIIIIGSLF